MFIAASTDRSVLASNRVAERRLDLRDRRVGDPFHRERCAERVTVPPAERLELRRAHPGQEQAIPRRVVTEEHALHTVEANEVRVPRAETSRFLDRHRRHRQQLRRELARAVDDGHVDNPYSVDFA